MEDDPQTIGGRDDPEGLPAVAASRIDTARRVAAPALFAFSGLMAGFILFAFFLSSLAADRAQSGLERRFARPLSYGEAPLGGVIPAGTPVARLDIPSIGVHQVVVEGTAASQLARGPGHLPVSPLPGQVGNSVIAAHRLVLGGAFRSLDDLRMGASIRVLTAQGHFTYVVDRRVTVPAVDTRIFQATTTNQLTLVTAANLSGTRRLAVVARLAGTALPSPPGRPSVLARSDGGLVGEGVDVAGICLWLSLLLLLAGAIAVAYRELPRRSAHLATTPVALLLAWLIYTNLVQVLPATL